MKDTKKSERESLRTRRFNLTLSDYEYNSIIGLAISKRMMSEEILENFIGDLVDGYHSSGSETRKLALEYFKDQLSRDSFYKWSEETGEFENIIKRAIIIEKESTPQDERERLKEEIRDIHMKYCSFKGVEETPENFSRDYEDISYFCREQRFLYI